MPTTVTVYNLNPAAGRAPTTPSATTRTTSTPTYKGVEFTATKRFSNKWQMQAGFTSASNRGGTTNGTDLNDPNVTALPDDGIIGNDSNQAFRLSGSYTLPWEINLAGSMIANNGYPYQSTYSVSRAAAATQGVTLTRATQTVVLSERGDERFDNVTMVDIRLSRAFRFGSRSFTPQVDFFNIGNADTDGRATTCRSARPTCSRARSCRPASSAWASA